MFSGEPLEKWEQLAIEARNQFKGAAAMLRAAQIVYDDAARLCREAKTALDKVSQEQIPHPERIVRYTNRLLEFESRCRARFNQSAESMNALFEELRQFPMEDEEPVDTIRRHYKRLFEEARIPEEPEL